VSCILAGVSVWKKHNVRFETSRQVNGVIRILNRTWWYSLLNLTQDVWKDQSVCYDVRNDLTVTNYNTYSGIPLMKLLTGCNTSDWWWSNLFTIIMQPVWHPSWLFTYVFEVQLSSNLVDMIITRPNGKICSGKVRMMASKLDILIYQLVHKRAMRFQRF